MDPSGNNPHMHVPYVTGTPPVAPTNPYAPASMYHIAPHPGLYYAPSPYALVQAMPPPASGHIHSISGPRSAGLNPHPSSIQQQEAPGTQVGLTPDKQERKEGGEDDEQGLDANADIPAGVEYPKPLATHAELVANKKLFLSRLQTFHALIGRSLRVPQLGGKELDLHLLYKEVTARGGLLQVMTERKWKEVTTPFAFPPTATNSSFVLRKFYIGLLHHFEQCHFFRRTGPLLPAPPVDQIYKKKGMVEYNPAAPIVPHLHIGQRVAGLIHSKSSHGYFVTVTIDGEQMHGILYHPPGTSVPDPSAAGAAEGDQSGQPAKKKRRKLVPHAAWMQAQAQGLAPPTQNRTAYNFFFSEWRQRLKAEQPSLADRDVVRQIGVKWGALTPAERKHYQDLAESDRRRYLREMDEWTAQYEEGEEGEEEGEGEGEGGFFGDDGGEYEEGDEEGGYGEEYEGEDYGDEMGEGDIDVTDGQDE